MMNFNRFYQILTQDPLSVWLDVLPDLLDEWNRKASDPRMIQWQAAVSGLPLLTADTIDLKNGVSVHSKCPLDQDQKQQLIHCLKQLSPWRKGPYSLYGTALDTEWRSDWKWDRLRDHITPLQNRIVLDVGCNSGYHLWRMLGQGARLAIGIDPMSLYLCQFEALRKILNQDTRAHLLPLGIEQLPKSNAFDTVFSMGVLYHRRSPLDHLLQLKDQLRPGGELILETLVIDGNDNTVLMPKERYAQMRNVYFIPSVPALEKWVYKCGFRQIRCIDVSTTTREEQRKTDWMTSDSLAEFLDPTDHSKTIEGYPAPKRAVLLANKG